MTTASPLSRVFDDEVELVMDVPAAPDGVDQWGNPRQVTVPVVYIARVKATGNNALIERLGLDSHEIALEGAFMRPAIVPATLQPGARFRMIWRGVPGVAILRQIRPRSLRITDETLGQRVVLAWTARPA